MKVRLTFEPANEKERAALTLLSLHPDRCAGEISSYGEPERQHRILGALIDILKVSIIP